MNPKLQKIRDELQQTEHLDAEQKNNLLKSLMDADKELEITAFKLERTEKVKRTTAILLEETIEELEQKRKAIEEQNRELEIETSLERVRAIALSLKIPADMIGVCQTISDQLKQLNITDVRNVQTVIINKSKRTYLNYQYFTAYDGSVVEEPEYDNHPTVLEMVQTLRKSADSFFTGSFEGEKLNAFREYRKQHDQFPDPIMDKADSIHYYFYSIGEGGLGLTTYKPLTEENLQIFKRFHNVFKLAYRRFIDIQIAEAQAREAEIELALERVRARTMAMQKSTELKEVIQLVYEQFVQLKIFIEHTGFIIDYKTNEDMHIWLADENGAPSEITIPYFDSPHWNSFKDAIKKRKNLFVNQLNFQEKNRFYRALFKHIPDLPEKAKDFYFGCPGLAISTVLLDNVGLYIENFSGIPYTDQENNTLLRFGKVFQQTYTRFLDLQKAEAQAREAKLEAALERVRARTMAMHHSEELSETAAVVFQQLIALGMEPNRIYIGIIKDQGGMCEFWITDEDGGKVSTGFTADLRDNASFYKMYQGWASQRKSLTINMRGKELHDYFIHLRSLGVPFKGGLTQKRRMQHIAYFSKGFIGVASPDAAKPETLDLLERFAAVFNLTYTRFHDLKQAEAQNRIIQAENERKTRELEDARRMQLAMLPKDLPQLPHLDIAVYMKTATEVGGDYYDFTMKEDGSLNICLGDATGHGMKAGIMVSSMKSIFTTNASKMEIEHFFATANTGIKSMNLQRMMIGFTMLTINHRHIRMINAGMPPVYLYRKKQRSVREIREHGMPIGAMSNVRYKAVEESLNEGDVLLMLTDGMPELQNEKKELYGYKRLQECFAQAAEKGPQEIIEQLNIAASQWIRDKDPEDDITYVVIKFRKPMVRSGSF